MKITVEFFYRLRELAREEFRAGPTSVEVDGPLTVGELLERAGIGCEVPRVVLVDGNTAGVDRELADGEGVVVFPPLEGG